MVGKAQAGFQIGKTPVAVALLQPRPKPAPVATAPVEVELVRSRRCGDALAAQLDDVLVPIVFMAKERSSVAVMRTDEPEQQRLVAIDPADPRGCARQRARSARRSLRRALWKRRGRRNI